MITSWTPPRPVGPPTALSPQQTQAILEAAVIQLAQADQRETGLKLLMENHPEMALPILLEATGRESDSEVRALELRLIGLCRDPSTADFLFGFTTHPDANTRAAAADAIGILHEPTFSIPLPSEFFTATAVTATKLPIDLHPLIQLHPNHPGYTDNSLQMAAVPLRSDIRDALEQMMLSAATSDQREAAARALVVWPPPQYKLRVAEWGVWLNDNGDLKLLQSVMDEIPPFVHRTGNPLAEFDDRVNQIMFTTKPILHITVDQPMAVDVNVVIHHGRPWFAYPNPDDFAVDVETLYDLKHWQPGATPAPKLLAPLEKTAIGSLSDVRQGYPWLEPHHITAGPIGSGMGGFNELTALGLRWQSLIVSPTRLPWMTLPDCGTDPRYAWWTRLRQVPSGWISSRGESERFLYYDGPTLEGTPVAIKLASDQLHLTLGKEQTDDLMRQLPNSLGNAPPPQAVLLIHRHNGKLTGQSIAMPSHWDARHTTADYALSEDSLQWDQVITTFRGMLQQASLTTDEADGLIAGWQQQFFQTDGTRLLLIMSRQDYDRFCPIDIRPKPTELARVGIVLTELQ